VALPLAVVFPLSAQTSTASLSGIVTDPSGAVVVNAVVQVVTPLPVGAQAVSGNLGRNVVRGLPLRELDFSVHRDFPIPESIRIRFQAHMFNVFNHPSFGSENGTLNSAAFGTTTSMANSSLGAQSSNGAGFNPIFNTGGPRNFQFAMKVSF